MKRKNFIPFWLKLFFSYTAIMVCMFSVILVIIYPRISSHSKKEIQTRLTEQAAQVIRQLEFQLDSMRGIYISVLIDDALQDAFIENNNSNSLDPHNYIVQKLENISNVWNLTTFIQLYDIDSNLFYDSRFLSSAPLIDNRGFEHACKNEGMYNFAVIEDSNLAEKTRTLSIGGIIRKDIVNKELGYFCVNLNLTGLQNLILAPSYTDGTLQILVDSEGNYVIGDNVPLPENFTDITSDAIVFNDTEYLLCKNVSKVYGFTHYILTPVEEAYQELNMLMEAIIMTIIMVILVSVIISFLLARQITSPIEKLTNMMNNYQGDANSLSVIQNLNLSSEFHILNDGLIQMSDRITTLINDVYQHKIMHQQLELETLYKAINPHFIYNMLDSIQWVLKLNKQETAIKMLHKFSNYLKNIFILNQNSQTVETMKNVIQGYCNLQNILYDDIEFEIDIPNELNHYELPSMLVLPIVENCYSHAFPNNFKGIKKIEVHAFISKNNLIIRVCDSGCGISEKDLSTIEQILRAPLSYPSPESGTRFFAFKNLQSRILLSCGADYGIEVKNGEKGTIVTLFLPLKTNIKTKEREE